MAEFITRVELHGVNHDHSSYQTLHEAMEDEGFSRTIIMDDDVNYHLPTAEYHIQGNFDDKQVMNKAKSAAETTEKKYAILVSQYSNLRANGLKEV